MGFIKIYYWPIIASVWMSFTCVISYFISVTNGHVYKMFPYISDTGTLPPESCVFGQMMNLAALFMLITLYFRYRIVNIKADELNKPGIRRCNKHSFRLGVTACIGVSMVGNFQETSFIGGHLLGANLAFLVGAVHFATQAYITWKLNPSLVMRYTRIILSALFIPLFVLTSVASTKSMGEFKPKHLVDILKWTENDPGYGMHLVATFSEWLMALDLVAYLFTYTVELREYEYAGIIIKPKDAEPVNSSPNKELKM